MTSWKWVSLLVLALIGVVAIYVFDRHSDRYPSTEDAYVDATAVHIASQVDGAVVSVSVASQQAVNTGERLFALDDTPYRAALAQAEAGLALARRQVAKNNASFAAASAAVADAEVKLDNARQHWQRVQRLEHGEYYSVDAAEDAAADYKRAQADLNVARARLEEARSQISADLARDDLVLQAEAARDQALWRLQHTVVTAPCDGFTESVGVHVGEAVRSHTRLFAVVCTKQFWVEANFKETQLQNIRPGQPVHIEVDMYPGREFNGVVESISPASGTAFSMLPPENATGNWVKVIQRVPVKIRVTDVDAQYPLRMGTSAVVRIDTQAGT